MIDNPSFDDPTRPTREYREGGVERTGGTVFRLVPDNGTVDGEVERVLADDRYTAGDWFDLPAPVYLVRDRTLNTVFRVVRLDERVELHVMATTEVAGLRAFYDRLVGESDSPWAVERTTE